MPDKDFQEKTEKATPKRRRDARKKGQVAKSMDATSVLILFSALGVFFFSGTWVFFKLIDVMRSIFQNISVFDIQDIKGSYDFLLMVSGKMISILLPFFLTIVVFGIAGNLIQVGVVFSGKPLVPNFSKLDPIKGMKKLVSMRSFIELIKSLIKIIIVGGVAYLTVKGEIQKIPYLMQLGVMEILSFVGITSLKICFYTCLVLILLAVLDYIFQRYQHEKDMKMTRQEVKEESKQTEGDPKVKQRIRKVQIEMFRLRMLNTVPEATVVITNPTQVAVAIKFDLGKMVAPVVIAKGVGIIAGQIRKIAKENGVPIVENKPVAQIIFKTIEIGDYIPAELYQIVAEIIAYIYRLQGKA